METNFTQFPSFRQSNDLNQRLRSFQTEQTNITANVSRRELDINLTTQEGDKVTISLDAKSAVLQGRQERYASDGNGLTYQKNEFTMTFDERELVFNVEGELNDEERRDIEKALKTLDRMLNHFANGLVKPMLAESKRLERLDTLAELEAQMSFERMSISAEQSQSSTVQSELPADAVQTLADALPKTAPKEKIVLELFEKAADMANKLAGTISTAKAPNDQLSSLTDQLLADYRQQLAQEDPLGVDIIDRMTDLYHDAMSKLDTNTEPHLTNQDDGIV